MSLRKRQRTEPVVTDGLSAEMVAEYQDLQIIGGQDIDIQLDEMDQQHQEEVADEGQQQELLVETHEALADGIASEKGNE